MTGSGAADYDPKTDVLTVTWKDTKDVRSILFQDWLYERRDAKTNELVSVEIHGFKTMLQFLKYDQLQHDDLDEVGWTKYLEAVQKLEDTIFTRATTTPQT